jgi:hypothetical protein
MNTIDGAAALAFGLFAIFGQQLDDGLIVDVDDAARRRRHHGQAHFLQCEGGCVEHLADMLGHVRVDPLVAGGRDRVPFDQRTSGEGSLQRIGGALESDVLLRRSEDDARGGLRHRLADLDEIA